MTGLQLVRNDHSAPPSSRASELHIIGAMLRYSTVAAKLRGKLTADHFYDLGLRQAWQIITGTGTCCDLTLFGERSSGAPRSFDLAEIAGATRLCYTSDTIEEHVSVLHEHLRRRVCREKAIRALDKIAAGESADVIADMMRIERAPEDEQERPLAMSAHVATAMQEIEGRFAPDAPPPMLTGYASLDEMINGWNPGELILLSGNTSMGKSTLAINLLRRFAMAGYRGLYFTPEMVASELIEKMLSIEMQDTSYHFRPTYLNSMLRERSGSGWGKLTDAAGALHGLPIEIDDRASVTVEAIAETVAKSKPQIIFVDHLGLVIPSGSRENRNQQISQISRDLKVLAKEANAPVVALAQLNRNNTGRDDKMPDLSDLRDSGSLEQDANKVLFVHRPDYWDKASNTPKIESACTVRIAKCRGGAVGNIPFVFNLRTQTFTEVE